MKNAKWSGRDSGPTRLPAGSSKSKLAEGESSLTDMTFSSRPRGMAKVLPVWDASGRQNLLLSSCTEVGIQHFQILQIHVMSLECSMRCLCSLQYLQFKIYNIIFTSLHIRASIQPGLSVVFFSPPASPSTQSGLVSTVLCNSRKLSDSHTDHLRVVVP